ncbi:MAG: hypothetical protein E7263_09575 [Lachnospiraceae bacterium]|nr:hypothetical protein [Lachnospiraceae bacterium]
MNYFDDEKKIIGQFQRVEPNRVWFPIQNDGCIELYNSLREDEFAEWIDSSKKSDPPPDFFNPQKKIMMDVMRVDDHGRITDKGKYINPVNQRESEVQRELRELGLLDIFPNVQGVFVNAVTDLPEKEDHNYQMYFDNFKRTVEKHISSIPLYKRNHPGYKTVFFVFDESSGYVVAESENAVKQDIKVGEVFYCRFYLHFIDRRFIEIFIDADIDYLIWFSPFKESCTDVPDVCIYDVKNLQLSDFEMFPEELIISTEG